MLRLHRARTWSSTPTAWSQDSCSEPDGLPRHDMLLQRLHLRFVHAATCSPPCARGVQVERPTQIHASERERAGEKRQLDEPIPQFPIPLSPRLTCMVTNVCVLLFVQHLIFRLVAPPEARNLCLARQEHRGAHCWSSMAWRTIHRKLRSSVDVLSFVIVAGPLCETHLAQPQPPHKQLRDQCKILQIK